MIEDAIGIVASAMQETATAGTYAQLSFFQPLAGKLPVAGDTGIVMDGVFHPALDGAPKPGDIVALATVPVTPAEKYCMQLEDVQILPANAARVSVTGIINPDNPGQVASVNDELYLVSDTPTEDDPDFDPADKDNPAYIRNEGIRFYTPSHAEYAPDIFNHTEGVGYIYAFNEDVLFTPKVYVDRVPEYQAASTAAQEATTAAYQRYTTASYTLQLPGVLQQQSQARQEAYDASYQTARAEVTAAEVALSEVQAQRDTAAQAAYDVAYAEYAEGIAAAQTEESEAASEYYTLSSQDVGADAQSAYDAVLAGGGSAEDAQAAYDQVIADHASAVDAAFNVWMEKSNALWTLQWQAQDSCYQAYQTEYDTWTDRVNGAQATYDAALASFDDSAAIAEATAAGEAAAATYDDEVEAARNHDENLVPQYKAADYRGWLDAQEAERIAKLRHLQAQYAATTPLCPNPDLRCPPTDIATYHPFWTNPDFPIPAAGTVWNGKPFTPPEMMLQTNAISQRPFLVMGVRAYRRGRLLSNRKIAIVLRIPGKIVIEYEKSTRKLKVTTPHSSYAKISAVYASTGAHLLLDADSGTEAVVNANGVIYITFGVPNDAIADYYLKKYLQPISVPINVFGEELTEDFSRTVWNPLPEWGQATRTVAVRLTEKPDYYMSANGTGDGLTPENPTRWDALLTPVALLGNTSAAALALRDKVVWLSGDPVTSQSTFKIPYGSLVIKGGFNSDFTAITGYSLLSKKTEMPGGTTIENFRADAPNIFALNSVSAYGTFRNCRLEGAYNGNETALYLFQGHSITLEKCVIQYSGVPAAIYAPYGSLVNCTIRGSISCIVGNLVNSAIHVSGVSRFCCHYGLGATNSDGICELFPANSHVHSYLDTLVASVNIGTLNLAKKSVLGGVHSTYPATKYTGESTYYPARDTPSILNSALQITLNAGADGKNGASGASGASGGDGECVCCSIPGVAVNSTIHITAAKPGNGGNGGNGSSSSAGRGGRGGSCVIVLPAKLRNTEITLSGGGTGSGGLPGASGRTPPTWPSGYPAWATACLSAGYHNTIAGRDGRFYVRQPFYWANSSFPSAPMDDLLPQYQLTDGSCYPDSAGNYSWKPVRTSSHIADLGRTALPVYWAAAGREGLSGNYSVTTTDGWMVPVRGYFGTDGGAAGNGAPLDGLTSPGTPEEGKAVAGKSGMAGFTAGEFLE